MNPEAGPPVQQWLWPLAAAMVLRVARGYRGFPAVDDYAYVPLARAALDPLRYAGDRFVHGFLLHSPVWTLVVRLADGTVGLPIGLWITTFLLTVATVFAAARLLRSAGLPAWLLPLFLALGFNEHISGIGRGAFDGALGDGFHAQWVALCLLLWCYDALARRHVWLAGILLGVAALAHPVVGLHGAIAIAVAIGFTELLCPGGWSRLWRIALACVVVGAPVIVPIASHMLHGASAGWPTARMIEQGFLFRAPHHYTLRDTAPAALAVTGLLAAAGLAALLITDPRTRARRRLTLGGLLAGHVLLAGTGVLLAGPLLSSRIAAGMLLPYELDLSRTSPLVLALGSLLLLAGVVDLIRGAARPTGVGRVLAGALFLALLTVLVLGVAWSPPLGLLVLAGVSFPLWRRGRALRLLPLATGALAAGALAWSAMHDVKRRVPDAADAELYRWAAANTARTALFIVPPGARAFRLEAGRGVYADFEVFPITSTPDIPEWRRRLELVAAPDRVAADSGGWSGITLWDRSYAVRNTPARIAELLARTHADYFVWDHRGLETPPYVAIAREPDPRVRVVFRNIRYEVYAREPGDAR